MSDLPSISDLLNKKPAAPAAGASAAKKPAAKKEEKPLVDESVQGKFSAKMEKIAEQEREVQAQRFAAEIGVPHIDLDRFPVSQQSLRAVPEEEAVKAGAVCFYMEGEQFRIGALDPRKAEVQVLYKKVAEEHAATGAVYVISKHSFDKVIKMYDRLPMVEAITKDVSISPEDLEKVKGDVTDFSSIQELVKGKSTTDMVTFVMGGAFKMDVSDVHIEAEEERVVVRYRVDGMLHDVADIPKEAFPKLVSRLKLLASLKLNITDKPQDGRFAIKMEDTEVDIRVSTMPTVYGESVVMRLLRQNREGISLDSLGFRETAYQTLVSQIERPNGMIITTGPTGSGKTTTLYSVMHMLNKPDVKIITLEDPVEYKMEGINQSQIDKSRDYTFAKGLKSILRQDPDICMVGEIRDLETAEIAIQAALTGHLMLSTLHTNSAAGAIARFIAMGVKPFLLAPALNAIIGQRLVRKLCETCREPHQLSEDEKARVNAIIEKMPEKDKGELQGEPQFFKPKGCKEACNGLGYKGRVGIYEVLLIDKEMEGMIGQGKVSEVEVEQAALAKGMTTMAQDGILKAAKGMTSLEEVFRVSE